MKDAMEIETLRGEVTAHPWRTVAFAFAVGAVYALAERSRGSLARAFVGSVAGSAFTALRSVASEKAGIYTRSWIDQRFTRGNMPAAPPQ